MNPRNLGLLMAVGGIAYLAYYFYTGKKHQELLSYVQEQTEKETFIDAGLPGTMTMVA